jgi:DNA topoisomerase-3
MIARRLIAVHYPDYEYESAKALTLCEGHTFRSAGSHPLIMGWKEVYQDMGGAKKDKDEESTLPALTVGEARRVQSVKVKAQKTKPPEPHTDATLLAAMENAGKALEDEELRETMRDSGLGTPATRAAMIERLIEVGYLTRKGKTILSTEKGEKLSRVAHEQLTSAELTGKWEKALETMAREKDSAKRAQQSTRFMDGIRRYAAFLVEQVQSQESDVVFDAEERRGKGRKKSPSVKSLDMKCPVCGQGSITENERAFGCSRWKQGCTFTIWKNALEKQGGPLLTANLVKLMIEKQDVAGSTGVIHYQLGSVPTFEKRSR